MAAFLGFAALLCLIVLATLLRPLWREARGVALGIGLITLLSTGLLYRLVGTPQALDPAIRQAPKTLEEAIVQLKAVLARDPQQAEGWALLGQAYLRMDDAGNARDAFAKAARLAPDNADFLAEAAQSRAMANPSRTFDADALALLEAALKADPNHQRARWFLGVAQRQAGKHADAAATWAPLLTQVSADTAASLRLEINAARTDAGLPPLAEPATQPAAAALLTVDVALDPALAERVRLRPDATIFVIARQPGSPMPVAAQKRAASELPFSAVLGDADSPMPTLKLSQMQEVELVARLSASGDASRQEGDLESRPLRVKLPADRPVRLVIDAQ